MMPMPCTAPRRTPPLRPAIHAVLALGLLITGCGRPDSAAPGAPAAVTVSADQTEAPATAAPEESTTSALRVSDLIGSAQKRLKAGAFDEAAAELLRVQAASSRISPEESASYRDTMGQAMTAAMEAAQKGDTRALAALQMLRAARGR